MFKSRFVSRLRLWSTFLCSAGLILLFFHLPSSSPSVLGMSTIHSHWVPIWVGGENLKPKITVFVCLFLRLLTPPSDIITGITDLVEMSVVSYRLQISVVSVYEPFCTKLHRPFNQFVICWNRAGTNLSRFGKPKLLKFVSDSSIFAPKVKTFGGNMLESCRIFENRSTFVNYFH